MGQGPCQGKRVEFPYLSASSGRFYLFHDLIVVGDYSMDQ